MEIYPNILSVRFHDSKSENSSGIIMVSIIYDKVEASFN